MTNQTVLALWRCHKNFILSGDLTIGMARARLMVEHPTAGEGGAISENDKSIKSDKGSTNHVQEVRSGVAGVWFVCSFHGQRSPGAGIKG
jgi:hypothetical protein